LELTKQHILNILADEELTGFEISRVIKNSNNLSQTSQKQIFDLLKELINSDTLAVFGTDNNIMKNTYEIKELKMEQVTVKEMMDKVGKKTFSGVVYDLTTNSMVLQTKRNTFYLNENKLKSWENDKMYVVKFTTGKKKVNYFSRNITKTLARSFKEILDWLKITPLPFFELLKKIGIQPKDLKGLLETLRDNKLVTLKEYHSTITEKG